MTRSLPIEFRLLPISLPSFENNSEQTEKNKGYSSTRNQNNLKTRSSAIAETARVTMRSVIAVDRLSLTVM